MDAEVAIVGGGPAGLSAALVLGRCRRRVVLYDSGDHRNDDTGAVHAFLSRDGIPPGKLRAVARAELRGFPTLEIRDVTVTAITRADGGYAIATGGGDRTVVRYLLLATGVRDVHPAITGAEALHGKKVLPCPYCDGWEHRDQPLAAYALADDRGARYAALIAQWSRDVTFYPGGPAALSDGVRTRLARRGVAIDERTIERLDDDGDGVRLWFRGGDSQRRAALFYHLGCEPGNQLARALGCALDDRGGIVVDRLGATSVDGVFAAGDATRDALLAIVGAGEGGATAVAINRRLDEDAWLAA